MKIVALFIPTTAQLLYQTSKDLVMIELEPKNKPVESMQLVLEKIKTCCRRRRGYTKARCQKNKRMRQPKFGINK
jgi:hypothetical protein